jgi:hypothetical protein
MDDQPAFRTDLLLGLFTPITPALAMDHLASHIPTSWEISKSDNSCASVCCLQKVRSPAFDGLQCEVSLRSNTVHGP